MRALEVVGCHSSVVLGSNPRWQLRFFDIFPSLFPDPFRWESFNLVFMNSQNLIIVMNKISCRSVLIVAENIQHRCLFFYGKLKSFHSILALRNIWNILLPVSVVLTACYSGSAGNNWVESDKYSIMDLLAIVCGFAVLVFFKLTVTEKYFFYNKQCS